jgi:DNA-binding transcriptional MerR regulator
LQQIVSLRQVGFPLDEIRRFLERHRDGAEVIRLHLKRLREQIEQQQSLCRRLEALAARFASADETSVDDYLNAIEEMTMHDKYFSKDQLDVLAARREQLGEAHLREVEQEWPRLIAEVRAEMEAGTDPKDPRMQALAKRWQELVSEFTGGDPAMAQSVANLYRGEPQVAQQNALEPSLFEYVRKAF